MKDSRPSHKRTLWIAVAAGVWLTATSIGWVGYTGSHGVAHHWNLGLPTTFPEFRVLGLLAARASNWAFGPSEVAYRLPSLLASVLIVASVAWFVDWPRNIDWKSQSAVLIACTLPLDAAMRSAIGPPFVAAGLLAIGTACILKGHSSVRYAGAVLLALGFMTHEISFFYVAIFCLTALAFDWRRFWRPILATVVISGSFVLVECATYAILMGDPLARYKVVAEATNPVTNYSFRFGGSALLFYAWPLRVLVFCRQWSFDLLVLLVTGIFAWRRMNADQKILFLTAFLLWFWLGYGTQVPWAYRPRSRAFHYYFPLTLAIAALLPYTLGMALAGRERLARGIVVLLICLHFVLLAAGGRWGQNIDVSRDLLRYTKQHEGRRFLTDAFTLEEMRLVNGHQRPKNVVDLEALSLAELVSDQQDSSSIGASETVARIDAILVNRERVYGQDKQLQSFVERFGGDRKRVSPVRYRLLFIPVTYLMSPKGFMIRSRGGEAVEIHDHKASE